MPNETKIFSLAQCDTCGHTYDGQLERCPKCQSNQKILRHLQEANLGHHGNRFLNVRELFPR